MDRGALQGTVHGVTKELDVTYQLNNNNCTRAHTHTHTHTYIHTHTHTMEYYSAIKKKEALAFATSWMDLEGTMLSEISQIKKGKYHMISFICEI